MDFPTEVRRAALIALKAASPFVALVPAIRVYGQSTPAAPTWPFAKTGVPITTPREATCLQGAETRFALHLFVGPRLSGGAIVETGEDHAGRAAAAAKAALHNTVHEIADGIARLRCINDQRLNEAEADHYHVILEFRARISA